MAKTLCKIFGVVLLLVGIAGFLKHDLLGMHLTRIHNIVHLLTAVIAFYFGFSGTDASARAFCQVFGVIYLLLGIGGFAAPDVIAKVIQSHAETGAENLMPDNIVHLLLGAVFLIVGLLRAPKPAAT